MERFGWKDRNNRCEYYNHCDVLIAEEPSLVKVVKLLKQPMAESIRIGVTMDYEALNSAQSLLILQTSSPIGRSMYSTCIQDLQLARLVRVER